MLKVYGTMQCPDCVNLKRDFDEKGIKFEFYNIEELLILKEFLLLRDSRVEFNEAKEAKQICIPCIVDGDKIELDYSVYLYDE